MSTLPAAKEGSGVALATRFAPTLGAMQKRHGPEIIRAAPEASTARKRMQKAFARCEIK